MKRTLAAGLLLSLFALSAQAIPLSKVLKPFASTEGWEAVMIKPIKWQYNPYDMEAKGVANLDNIGKTPLFYQGARTFPTVLSMEINISPSSKYYYDGLDSYKDKGMTVKIIRDVCPNDMDMAYSKIYQINVSGKHLYATEEVSKGASGDGSFSYHFFDNQNYMIQTVPEIVQCSQ